MSRSQNAVFVLAAGALAGLGCTTSGSGTAVDGAAVDGSSHGNGNGNGNGDADASVSARSCEDIDRGEVPPDPDLPADRCEVSSGGGDGILYRGVVLAPEGPLAGGEVVTIDERIACVGDDCAGQYPDATVVDCGRAVISPGLINPHDHMMFNENGPLDPVDLDDTRYDHRHEWRGELSAPGNTTDASRHGASSLWVELRQLLGGTTTVVGSGNASDVIRHLDDLRNRDRDHGFREVVYDTFPLGDPGAAGDAELIPPEDCDWNYRRTALEASEFAAYIPHVAEGIDHYAAEEFRCLSNGVDEGARNLTQPNASHIHSIGLKAVDLHRMAHQGTRLVWSLRSNIALYGTTADVSTFYRFGGTIALSTDWAYTGSANMFRELACADSYNRTYLDGIFCDRDLWEMATINAAVAAGNDHAIGSLEEGKIADILVVDGEPGAYRAVLEAASRDVLLVTLAGETRYGDRDILEALGDPCDPIDVCGEERGVCLSRLGQVDMTYDELADAMDDGAYPVFFCDEPPSEPTCVPSRPGEFSGVISDDDRSGDGIPTGEDLCPEVFHPIRPIDDGRQADFDGDGIGDPCDESPVPDDIAGDGIPNDEDNCPYDPNPDQTDTSGDGLGDACHPCPERYAPDGVCPPPSVTIREIHEDLDEGDEVFVSGAVVTGVYNQGLTIQDPDPEGGSAVLSGLTVFLDARPDVEIGDVVDVSGEKVVFFGNVQIQQATVEVVGSAEPIEPTEVTVAQAESGDFQGVLVRLVDGEVTDEDYDCECPDDDLWEVGGAVIVYDRLYEDGDWTSRIGELPVSGVMMFRFSDHRLMPRTGADF